jgi:phenylacetate-CoA ligase
MFLLRGEGVRQALAGLEESQWYDRQRLRDIQSQKLHRVVDRAYRAVPFYRALFDRHGIEPAAVRSIDDLSRLPFLLPSQLSQLRASVSCGRPAIRRWTVRRTSGSTGIPRQVYVDGPASAHSLAARIRSQGWYGVALGDKQVRLWGRPASFRRRRERLKDWLLNRRRFDAAAFEPYRFEAAWARITSFAPDYIYGFPSIIAHLAEQAAARGGQAGRLGLKAAVCTAEESLDYQRRRMSALLGCPVINEYGCGEVDIISYECPHGGSHIMAENVIVEIVDIQPSGSGVGEVVVTDLNNQAMPLVRYRLGDLAALSHEACPCGRGLPLLRGLSGRAYCNYVVTPAGDHIHTAPFSYLFGHMAEQGRPVLRFRIIQEDPVTLAFHLVLAAGDHETRQWVEQHLIREAAEIVGKDMRCHIEFVDELPPSTQGAKSPLIESRLENDDRN